MHLVTFPEAAVPFELRSQVVALQREAWPPTSGAAAPERDDAPALTHDPALDPRSLLLVDEGRVLAALDILSKELTHAGRRYAVSGLSTVVTAAEARRQGHGRRLVAAGRAAIESMGADLALFTCDAPLGPFYEQAGWTIVPDAVIVGGTPTDPFPSDRFDKVTLGAFFSDRARRHASTFTGARIELYPGEIDRLW
jgi:aminoglycoside 2'-N-acetyltransferase I